VKGRKGEQERRRKGEKERCWKEAALERMHFVHGRELRWKGCTSCMEGSGAGMSY